MAFFLGIDGGGSKTTFAVGDESAILGRSSAPSCKIQSVGEEAARAALQRGIAGACTAAKISPQDISRACIGVAGVSRADIADKLRAMIATITPAAVEVVGDNVIAMEAAFGGGAGVIVAAGTGSIAHGRNEVGEQARAGGWGAAVSDEGSGGWIGRQAVAAALRTNDRGQSTALLDAVMAIWQAPSPEDIARVANGVPPPDFAALFPLVMKCADARDVVAAEVLRRAGVELAQLALILIERLWPVMADDRVRVALAGGIFRNSALVRRAFFDRLLGIRRDAAVNFAVVDPVTGALQRARRAGGVRG